MEIINDQNNASLVIVDNDYQSFFNQELLKFVTSAEWEHQETNFRRELQLHTTPGDLEMLKMYLREQRENCLQTFRNTKLDWLWDKCYSREKDAFDAVKFVKKLDEASEGHIEAKDLQAFFSYYCMNRMIETLLSQTLEYERQGRQGTFNVFINHGEVKFASGTCDEEQEDVGDEDLELKNIIFNSKIFDSADFLIKLRGLIAQSMDMGEWNAMFGKSNAYTINSSVKSEWYYVMKAIEEAGIARRFTVMEFIDQMLDWFPWLCEASSSEELQTFKRKISKSISHEKSIWKYGKTKEVTRFKDMWARYNKISIDYAKLERLYAAAYTGLCQKLIQLKEEIQKERAGH